MRHPRNIRIAQQWQYRMIERSRRNLDLPFRRILAIHRQYPPQSLALFASHHDLIVARKIAPLRDQRPQLRIAAQQILIEPGDLAENLQIAQILNGKSLFAALVQLLIPWIAMNNPLHVYLKEVLADEVPLRLAQRLGRLQRAIEKRI